MSIGMGILNLRREQAVTLFTLRMQQGQVFAQHVWLNQKHIKAAEDTAEKVAAELVMLDLIDQFTKPMHRTFDFATLDRRTK